MTIVVCASSVYAFVVLGTIEICFERPTVRFAKPWVFSLWNASLTVVFVSAISRLDCAQQSAHVRRVQIYGGCVEGVRWIMLRRTVTDGRRQQRDVCVCVWCVGATFVGMITWYHTFYARKSRICWRMGFRVCISATQQRTCGECVCGRYGRRAIHSSLLSSSERPPHTSPVFHTHDERAPALVRMACAQHIAALSVCVFFLN